MPSTLYIDIPKDFSFRATVYSHGWCELAPFALDVDKWRLSYVFSDGKSVTPATIYEEKKRLRIDLANSKIKPERIIRYIRHMLRLDDDLSGLYAAVTGSERLEWLTHRRAGRLLRSPTVWEDLVKTMCTTNCSWALTKIMVNNLVSKLGQRVGTQAASLRAFPTVEAMVVQDEAFYRSEIKAGYRAPYFVELAGRVASGELDPEQWLHSELPTPELKNEMKKVKGVGDYAAENLLKLVGRYDGLALDSWLRSQFYKNHNKGKMCKDIKIERHYKKYGEWRGLVIWCDMTEKWIT
jgi:3-methyladenine DNA glycosylase/8-oxoguanine DNA glycosylase